MRFVAPQFALEGHFERFLVPVGGPQERGTSDQAGDDAVITMSGAGWFIAD